MHAAKHESHKSGTFDAQSNTTNKQNHGYLTCYKLLQACSHQPKHTCRNQLPVAYPGPFLVLHSHQVSGFCRPTGRKRSGIVLGVGQCQDKRAPNRSTSPAGTRNPTFAAELKPSPCFGVTLVFFCLLAGIPASLLRHENAPTCQTCLSMLVHT